MSEAKFKKAIHRGFLDFEKNHGLPLHWQLHEDSDQVGIPDISYGIANKNGWIEAKWDRKVPRPDARYTPHFEPYQEAWLVARGNAGGNCHLVHGFSEGVLIMSHKALMRRRPNMTIMDIADLPGSIYLLNKFDKEAAKFLIHGITC